MSQYETAFLFFIIGCFFGSFFNVVATRIPRKLPFIIDRSSCPACEHNLKPQDLFPIFSYLFLKGKCRYCHNKIDPSYPAFELITGILFATSYYAAQGNLKHLLFYITLSSLMIILTRSDLAFTIVPDSILVFFSPFLIYFGAVLFDHQILVEGFIIAICMILLYTLSRGNIGGGDIKLFILLGFTFGIQAWLYIFYFSISIGFLYGVIMRFKNRELKGIPFVPFIAISTLLYIFFTEKAWALYAVVLSILN